MKRDIQKLDGRFGGIAAVFLAFVVSLFPSSPMVLCIAPGGHIAFEDMDSPCCASAGVSSPAACQPDAGFNAAGYCHNCTDFFMTPNGRGAISESYDQNVASPLVGECPENHISAHISLSLCRAGVLADTDASIPVSSFVPLRC